MAHRGQTLLSPQHQQQRHLSVSRSGCTATSCIYCGRNFDSIEKRRAHESDHFVAPEYRIWRCDFCRRRFYSSVAVEQHIHSKHAKCRFCVSRKENSASIRKPGEFFCGDCDRSFSDVLDYLQHDQAAHLSCQHCQQIGRVSRRVDFDRHCCGCDIEVTDDRQMEQHYRNNPTHYHDHPNFKPKQNIPNRTPESTSLATEKCSSTPRLRLNTTIPNPVKVSITPATPTEDSNQMSPPVRLPKARPPSISQTSRYGLPPQLSLTASPPPTAPRFVCTECRIPFPEAAILARHKSFSFNLRRRCNTVFVCPFSLLRHVELGQCCQWSATQSVVLPGNRRATVGGGNDDKRRKQDA